MRKREIVRKKGKAGGKESERPREREDCQIIENNAIMIGHGMRNVLIKIRFYQH